MSDAPIPFTPRTNRQAITHEPDPGGRYTPLFPDSIGYKSQGGGKVPADFGWHTNPKQWQEELTPAMIEARQQERALPKAPLKPELPAGAPAAEAPKP